MKLTDFADLESAQAHEDVLDTKQIGSGQARGFLVNTDVWKTIKLIQQDIEHPFYSLADAVVTTSNDGSSYFGMDETKIGGQSNYAGLAGLVAAGVMTQTQADDFADMRYTRTKPYINTTQAEFDEAKLLAERNVPTSQTTTYYGVVSDLDEDKRQEKHVRVNKRELIHVQVLLDEVATYDRKFTLSAEHKLPEATNYIKFGSNIYTDIVVKSGELGAEVYLSVPLIEQWSKWNAKADTIGGFTLLVKAA